MGEPGHIAIEVDRSPVVENTGDTVVRVPVGVEFSNVLITRLDAGEDGCSSPEADQLALISVGYEAKLVSHVIPVGRVLRLSSVAMSPIASGLLPKTCRRQLRNKDKLVLACGHALVQPETDSVSTVRNLPVTGNPVVIVEGANIVITLFRPGKHHPIGMPVGDTALVLKHDEGSIGTMSDQADDVGSKLVLPAPVGGVFGTGRNRREKGQGKNESDRRQTE